MKAFPVVAAAAFAAAALSTLSQAAVLQGEATYDLPQPVASAVSRADVRAEAIAARQAGRIVGGEHSGVADATDAASTPTRDAVRARIGDGRPSQEALRAEPYGFTVAVDSIHGSTDGSIAKVAQR